MLGSAIAAMRDVQLGVVAHTVLYRHAGGELAVRAVPGRTVYRAPNEFGVWLRTETRDFIVPAEELPLEPRPGDVVVFDGVEYEVLAPRGEHAWRWSDPYHTAKRIHAKMVGGGT